MTRDRRRRGQGHAVGSLRNPESAQQVTYVELFFDLVMVFALNRLVASAVPGLEILDPDGSDSLDQWAAVGRTLLLFVPLVWTWTITSYVTARFDPRTPGAQWSILVSAFAMLAMGTSVPHAFNGAGLTFALAYTFALVSRVLIFGYVLRGHPLGRLFFRGMERYSEGLIARCGGFRVR